MAESPPLPEWVRERERAWHGFVSLCNFCFFLMFPASQKHRKKTTLHNDKISSPGRRIPGVKRSIDKAAEQRATIKAKVWHDNEKFLLNQAVYRRNGMEMINFPPNSGDLNPIETVWARLRLDLAKMEQKDFSKKPRRYLSTSQFKARVASLLKSYGEVQEGEEYSFLTKLVRGMPKRLAGCRAKHFGRCGK